MNDLIPVPRSGKYRALVILYCGHTTWRPAYDYDWRMAIRNDTLLYCTEGCGGQLAVDILVRKPWLT